MSDEQNSITYPGGKVRLYVEAPLGEGARVVPDEAQVHYLLHVMRAKAGDTVRLFNGRDGEWLASVTDVSKRSCVLGCRQSLAHQVAAPNPAPLVARQELLLSFATLGTFDHLAQSTIRELGST